MEMGMEFELEFKKKEKFEKEIVTKVEIKNGSWTWKKNGN